MGWSGVKSIKGLREVEQTYERLAMFHNEMAVSVVRKFSGFSPREEGEKEEVERFIVCLARLDAWVVTVVRCLTARETCWVSGGSWTQTHRDGC